ncbi:serpin family protein [Paenibacillus tengchongensis]|uniref:serpin family protein n=1 Tax=Paenibacillus tengchongensis TaxID=2608684 RepID=UPI001651D166|nr:serpin family protein [Paenibacillus tengchongensis]
MKLIQNILAVPLILLLASCGSGPSSPAAPADGIHAEQAGNGLARHINSMGIQVLDELRQEKQGNLIISPYSIYTALALAYNGAAGETAGELGKLLGYAPDEREVMNNNHRNLFESFEKWGDGAELKTANSVWGQKGLKLLGSYKELVGDNYSASVHTADLSSDQTVADINRWVSDHTEDKITELLDTPFTTNPAAVLLNALYFSAAWKEAFPEQLTAAGEFTLEDGTAVQAMMMQQGTVYMYAETADWQAVRIPFSSRGLGMLVLLPGEHSSVEDIQRQMMRGEIPEAQRMESKQGRLILPRFSASFAADLRESVQALGVERAFSPKKGDFSELVQLADPIYIDCILHKTFIHVDEQGTEGAAATLAGLLVGGAAPEEEPFEMKVNRPFLFAIEDWASGVWLFLGIIANPLDPS